MLMNGMVAEPDAQVLDQVNFAQQAILSASEFSTLGPMAQTMLKDAYHKLEEVKDLMAAKYRSRIAPDV